MKVEDHGNGFMVIGTLSVHDAAVELSEYVDNIQDYRFACPTSYGKKRKPAVWLTTAPGQHWDGARDHCGKPLR